MIRDLKFRHIRFVKNGIFRKAQRKFRDYKTLLNFLNKIKAEDSYYSVSCWLNPKAIGKKQQEDQYKTVFLKADLFFDIDEKSKDVLLNIEKAKLKALSLLDYLKEHGYKVNYIAFSGSKGFHISCKDPFSYEYDDPKIREEKASEIRKKLLKEFEIFGIDKGVFIDTRRIVRLPFTYNFKSGYMCLPITKDYLESIEPKDLLNSCPKILLPAKSKDAMISLREMPIKSMLGGTAGVPPGVYYVHAISSQIAGKGKHVLIMQQGIKTDNLREELLKNNVNLYSIIDAFGKRYIASPLMLDKNKVIKIMRRTKSSSLNAFLKYGHSLLPYGYFYDEKFNKIIKTKILFIFNKRENKYDISYEHAKLFCPEVFKEFYEKEQKGKEHDKRVIVRFMRLII